MHLCWGSRLGGHSTSWWRPLLLVDPVDHEIGLDDPEVLNLFWCDLVPWRLALFTDKAWTTSKRIEKSLMKVRRSNVHNSLGTFLWRNFRARSFLLMSLGFSEVTQSTGALKPERFGVRMGPIALLGAELQARRSPGTFWLKTDDKTRRSLIVERRSQIRSHLEWR
jgi:hypothetical protein